MAIQIRGSNQIISGTVSADRLNLTDTFDFTGGVVQVATPSNGSDAATKDYVDSQVGDGFQAGDGISIDTATSPDTISVKLAATNPMLQFVGTGTDELQVKLDPNKGLTSGAGGLLVQLKAESGGTISVDASGLYIANSAISNAKLANSSISGVSLGSNLYSLSATGVLSMSSYDGSAAVSDLDLNYDAAMFDNSAGSLIIKNLGVDTAQLADGAVETAKINDSAVTSAKIDDGAVVSTKIADSSITLQKASFSSYWDVLSPNGSTSAFDLSKTLQSACQQIFVIKNGLVMKQVASSPSGSDEYTVSLNGGTAGVGQITFGAAPASGEDLRVWFIANN